MAKKKKLEAPPREARIESILTAAKSAFGADSLRVLGKDEIIAWPSLTTGLLSLDRILGIGGVARGRSTEVFGPEGCGKTTLCLQLTREAQLRDGIAVYVDVEHALDLNYASSLGVDTESLLLCQPDSGEQAVDMALLMADNLQDNDIVVIDSVAALVPIEELEGGMGDQQMGAQARLMGKAVRKCTKKIADKMITAIWVNQLREKIGGWAKSEKTPGGNALKFGASMRLDLRRIGGLKNDGGEYGADVKIKTLKNKLATPFKETVIGLIYGEGFSRELDLITTATKLGVIERSGAWYSFEGERLGQGADNSRMLLKGNKDIFERIYKKSVEKMTPLKVIELSEEEKKKMTEPDEMPENEGKEG
jgi:recombination protein RecA